MCRISRVLIASWVAGVLATDLAHSELVGWIAAVAVGVLVYAARSLYPRLLGGTCPVPDREVIDR